VSPKRRGTGTYLPSEVLVPEGGLRGWIHDQGVAGHEVQRLLGFWLCWHALGGFEPLVASGLWSRGGAYRQLQQFREQFRCSPDELLPELAVKVREEAATWPEKFARGLDPVLEQVRAEQGALAL
jgi:hypothetical protein